MHRLVIALTCLIVAVGLAACGGGGKSNQAVPPSATKTGATGPVSAQPTTGLIGPAESVLAGRAKIVGKTKPITPADVKPTGAKLHGVSAESACASASANPSN